MGKGMTELVLYEVADPSSLPMRLEAVRTALVEALSDFERLRVRDHARAVQEAAAILKRRDIQTEASILVQAAEREIAKANPSKQGKRNDMDNFAIPDSEVHPKTLTAIRTAHSNLDDSAFEVQCEQARETGEPLTRKALLKARAKVQTHNVQADITPPAGLYRTIVIDPPWPMKKIERDVRPNQYGLDYPTMSEDELSALAIPAMADAHLFLWTTHRFLPMAFRLLDAWAYKYVCAFVWHKPGGFQPVGLPQYNCEFALYGRRGAPAFTDTKALFTCFDAPRRQHSRKPDEFYDTVRRVADGPRIDMFSREPRDGFEQWGNETAKFEGPS